MACASDGECAYLGTTCNFVEGVCHVKSLAEVEVEYVKCYLETISSSVEVNERMRENRSVICNCDVEMWFLQSYMREYVLPSWLEPYPRNSSEFFTAVMAAASVGDCVNPQNALDLTHRTALRHITDPVCGKNWAFDLDPCTLLKDCWWKELTLFLQIMT